MTGGIMLAAAVAATNVDVGRQLFLDDRLVAERTAKRVWHRPTKYAGNPVLKPETELELGGPERRNPMAAPFSGGVWYDGREQIFKCWYHAGWANGVAYAWSEDGISWTRPKLNEDGSNLAWRIPGMADSAIVFLDPDATDGQRFKAFNYVVGKRSGGVVMTSADGIRWTDPVWTAECGDRSTMFYNPFTKRWCFSLRCTARTFDKTYGRSREYAEAADFVDGAKTFPGVREWLRQAAVGRNRGIAYGGEQLYNFDCVAYESVMIGLAEIMLGPENCYWGALGLPKMVELRFGFNATPQDADSWEFPSYAANASADAHHTSFFISETRRFGDWDMGYLKSCGGICVVIGDELRFYYGGFAGDPAKAGSESNFRGGMYANASMGFATLRRDGFCSVEGGELRTKSLVFTRGDRLWLNLDAREGAVTVVATAAADGRCLGSETFTGVDSTRKSAFALTPGVPFVLTFKLTDGARLYSFWTSDGRGRSGGYLAAGSPESRTLRDE